MKPAPRKTVVLFALIAFLTVAADAAPQGRPGRSHAKATSGGPSATRRAAGHHGPGPRAVALPACGVSYSGSPIHRTASPAFHRYGAHPAYRWTSLRSNCRIRYRDLGIRTFSLSGGHGSRTLASFRSLGGVSYSRFSGWNRSPRPVYSSRPITRPVFFQNHYYRRSLAGLRPSRRVSRLENAAFADRLGRDRRWNNMPRLHIVQILGVIDNDTPSTFDLPPAGEERNLEVLDLPAWRQLRKGESAIAHASFKELAPDAGNSGAAQVGYAIAAAELKRFHVAAYAMREAYDNDPEGAALLTLSFEMTARVEKLSRQCASLVRRYGEDYAHAGFLQAAFAALAQDHQTAREAIEKTISNGDRSASARNLLDSVTEDDYREYWTAELTTRL